MPTRSRSERCGGQHPADGRLCVYGIYDSDFTLAALFERGCGLCLENGKMGGLQRLPNFFAIQIKTRIVLRFMTNENLETRRFPHFAGECCRFPVSTVEKSNSKALRIADFPRETPT